MTVLWCIKAECQRHLVICLRQQCVQRDRCGDYGSVTQEQELEALSNLKAHGHRPRVTQRQLFRNEVAARKHAGWHSQARTAAELFEDAFPCSPVSDEWCIASYESIRGPRPALSVWSLQMKNKLFDIRRAREVVA